MAGVSGSNDELTTMLRAPDLGERFRFIRCLGSGGMGDVYLAEDVELHRKVAVKTVREDLSRNDEIRKRIERECLLHARVGPHPRIVTLFDKIEREGRIHLIMEYVDGDTLSALLERQARERHRGPALPPEDAVELLAQCLDALSRIHAAGVVHRDIKPANIMVTHEEGGRVCAKLMDFGIARLQDSITVLTQLTTTPGASPGTPLYMAPEQVDPNRFGAVSYATDIYAMGTLFYQVLSGRPPFVGALIEVLNGHVNVDVPPVELDLPAPLCAAYNAVIQCALAKHPEDRYPSATAFREALLSLRDSAPRDTAVEDQTETLDAVAVPSATHLTGKGHTQRIAVSDAQGQAAASRAMAKLSAAAAVLIFAVAIGWWAAGHFREGAAPVTPPVDGAPQPESAPAPEAGTPPPVETPATAGAPPKEEAPAPDVAPSVAADGQPSQQAGGGAQAPQASAPAEAQIPQPPDLAQPSQPDTGQPPVAAVLPQQAPPQAPQQAPGAPAPAVASAAPPAAPDPGSTYVVQPGDSLSKIADQFKVDMVKLAEWNLLPRPDALTTGTTLYLYERPNLPKVKVELAPSAPKDGAKSHEDAKTPYRNTAEHLFVPATPAEPAKPTKPAKPENRSRKKP